MSKNGIKTVGLNFRRLLQKFKYIEIKNTSLLAKEHCDYIKISQQALTPELLLLIPIHSSSEIDTPVWIEILATMQYGIYRNRYHKMN